MSRILKFHYYLHLFSVVSTAHVCKKLKSYSFKHLFQVNIGYVAL